MSLSLEFYFLIFVFYSFFGWCMEVVVTFFCTKKLVNRGFLIGPVCPIYGFGSLLIMILLNRYTEDPIALFVMAIVLCSILEYFTSYLMEKLFKARWWDYSNKKFHINGRICLENIVAFGGLALLMMYFINPFLMDLLSSWNVTIVRIIAIVLLVIYVIDAIISLKVISGFKNVAKSINKDSTEEITKKVKELLVSKGGLYKRLVSAFNFEASEKLIKDITKRVKKETLKVKNKAGEIISKGIENTIDTKEKIIEEYKEKKAELKKLLKLEKKKKKEKLNKLK